jgi:hypothetical protein
MAAPSSPGHATRQDELAAVYISVAATDDSSLQTIYAHTTYHADDILWNHRFVQSCVEMDHLQTLCFDKFQMHTPLPGCSGDDSASNGSRHSSMSNLTAADAPARHAEAAYTARDRLEHVRACFEYPTRPYTPYPSRGSLPARGTPGA